MAERRALTATSTKLFYGLGSVSFGVKDNGFQTILLPFYNLVLHLPAQLVGLAIFIALLADAFLDPIVGHFSDNLHTRWGRRHPLMYLSALPVAVSYLLLWNPPALSQWALFAYLIVVAIVVRTFITFYEIPSSALVPELTEDYDERTSFTAIGFSSPGMADLPCRCWPSRCSCTRTRRIRSVSSIQSATATMDLVAAIVMFLRDPDVGGGNASFHSVFPQAAKCGSSRSCNMHARCWPRCNNRAFVILILAAASFFNFATGLVFALTFYVNTFFWKLNNSQIGFLTLATFLAVLLCVPHCTAALAPLRQEALRRS